MGNGGWDTEVGWAAATAVLLLGCGSGRVDSAARLAQTDPVQGASGSTYDVRPDGDGLVADHAQHGWRVTLSRGNVQLETRASAPALNLHAARYGCRGEEHVLGAVAPAIDGAANRVAYARPDVGLTEWYVNGPTGVEQGFALDRPACQHADETGITLAPTPGYRVSVSPHVATLTSEDGRVVRYADLRATDADGRDLDARLEPRGDGLGIAVQTAGATYPVRVDPLVSAVPQELLARDGASVGGFGDSTALSGDTALIGASGSAYTFVQCGPTWTPEQAFRPTEAEFSFGSPVALAGDTALVGAYADAQWHGAVHVFTRSGSTWAKQQVLTARDGARDDSFGESVALFGETALVGASRAGGEMGAAYVFVRNGAVWAEQQKLLPSTPPPARATFGETVALGNDVAFVTGGARYYYGAVYVFARNGAVWTEKQKLVASDAAARTCFGNSLAVSADTALIGDIEEGDGSGAVYVFVRNGATWAEQQKLTASVRTVIDYFGQSVALLGDTALIGAGGTAYGGAAHLWMHSGSAWAEQQKLALSDGQSSDWFGQSVALSSDAAFVGAYGRSDTEGAVYAFARGDGDASSASGRTACEPPHSDSVEQNAGCQCRAGEGRAAGHVVPSLVLRGLAIWRRRHRPDSERSGLIRVADDKTRGRGKGHWQRWRQRGCPPVAHISLPIASHATRAAAMSPAAVASFMASASTAMSAALGVARIVRESSSARIIA
jgi:hypothetical protein